MENLYGKINCRRKRIHKRKRLSKNKGNIK
nr:MAG TPA: hypothetical protein [Caudoviricetes sp.]